MAPLPPIPTPMLSTLLTFLYNDFCLHIHVHTIPYKFYHYSIIIEMKHIFIDRYIGLHLGWGTLAPLMKLVLSHA